MGHARAVDIHPEDIEDARGRLRNRNSVRAVTVEKDVLFVRGGGRMLILRRSRGCGYLIGRIPFGDQLRLSYRNVVTGDAGGTLAVLTWNVAAFSDRCWDFGKARAAHKSCGWVPRKRNRARRHSACQSTLRVPCAIYLRGDNQRNSKHQQAD